MAEVFPPAGLVLPSPDWGYKISPDADVQVSKLGDGYEVRTPSGLNFISENLSPTWSSLDPDVGLAAYNFLKARLRWKGLLFTDPISGQVYKVTADSVALTYDTWGNAVLDVQFRQDFNPS
ncbi:putative minor tail protein [Pseudomonas phage UAntarctica]|nr:putative minor tail protein [Pseudomonas phage UAntarctica]